MNKIIMFTILAVLSISSIAETMLGKPQNWQQMTYLQDVGNDWAYANCSVEVAFHLVYKSTGAYLTTDRDIIRLNGKYVFNDV